MEITQGLVPNCSEFTFYVNLDKSGKNAIKRFKNMVKEIEKLKDSGNDSDLDILGKKYGVCNDVHFERNKILRTDCYVVSGDVGDHGEKLGEKIEETGVVWEYKEN